MASKQYKAAGEDAWRNKTDKVVSLGGQPIESSPLRTSMLNVLQFISSLCAMQSSELFTMTYGALVIQLIKDYQNYAEVNKQLDKMCVY